MRYLVDDSAFTVQPLDGDNNGPAWSWFDDDSFAILSRWWTQASWQRRYTYQFRWLGVPIIQLPMDVVMMQEIIWRTRPDIIVETGIAHGGSVILHASLLRLVHGAHDTRSSRPRVIAVDVDLRAHNRQALESHALRSMFTLIEGSSIDDRVIAQVRRNIAPDERIMVVLDSNHTREHVAAELAAYAPLVSPGCALVVMDGIMPALADLPAGNPRWRSDHPDAALQMFLSTLVGRAFAVNHSFDGYALTHSPGGVLMRHEESRA